MYALEENYEPDEILMDESSDLIGNEDEEYHELSLDNERDAVEGYSFLTGDVESPEELFTIG